MRKEKHGKTKLCFIANKAYQLFDPKAKSSFGGAEVQFYLLANELAKDEGLDIHFIVGDFGQTDVKKQNGITLHKFLNPHPKDNVTKKIYQAFKLWRLMKKIEADVFLTTTANSVAAVVSLFCKANQRKHVHRTSSDKGVNGEYIKENGLLGKLYKFGLEKADLIITQNEVHKKLIWENHHQSSEVIRNIALLEEGKDVAKDVILWVSRCHPLKKPEHFIDLAEKFEQEKFVMICPSTGRHDEHMAKIKKMAAERSNLEFLDFVPFEEIQNHYNRAKAFVCTSDYEGFPNTLIQSGIGKTPYLSLNVNPDNILTEKNCGFFASGDMKKLEQGLRRVLEGDEYANQLGANLHSYIAKNHSSEEIIKKLKQIISDIL